jgi:4-amino-4-deoxy-L-arabinose transferase-like glycosyltransferase
MDISSQKWRSRLGGKGLLLVPIAALFAAIQIAASAFGPYGYFIDELYYLACSKRLAWGYVDHPPLSIAILSATRALFGPSQVAIRLPAIAAVAASICVASALARRFGGGVFAQVLAALAFAASPIALVVGSFYSMNAFELLLWPLVALAFVELIDRGDGRVWLLIGLLFGVGLENKHTMVVLAAGLAVGVAMTPLRKHALTRWPWMGLSLALAILLPNLLWQRAHGFPSLEFYQNAQAFKNVPTPPLQAIVNQIKLAGPGALPVWVAGALWLVRAEAARPYRALGWAFAALFAIVVVSGSSRPDRIAAFYPVVFAAGAVAIERWTLERRRAVRAVALGLVVAFALALSPMILPILPPATVAAYAKAIGGLPRIERGKTSPLPQWLADRTGWESLVDDVERVYRSLPPEDQARALIYCGSYGPAGALELFGAARGLPPVISGHNTYWLWGPGGKSDVLIALDADERDLDALFDEHHVGAVHRCAYCMSWRDEMAIVVAKGVRRPLSDAWDRAKHFE